MKPFFDRLDICQAYYLYAYDYGDGGYATGRREAFRAETNSDIFVRLSRMGYRPSPLFDCTAETLDTDNARAIYRALVSRREGGPQTIDNELPVG